jgi:hypothetical protein
MLRGWGPEAPKKLKNRSALLRVNPTPTHYSDIASAIPSGSIYGMYVCIYIYILAFFLAYTLTFLLAFYLASILTFYLAD